MAFLLNLSIFSRGGEVPLGSCEISLLLGERGVNIYLTFSKIFKIFSLFLNESCNILAEGDENFEKVKLMYMRVATKLSSKNIQKKLYFSFLLLEGDYTILPY